MSGVVTEQHLL